MAFSVASKFIGSSRLVGSNVVNLSSTKLNSWRDTLFYDSVTPGLTNLWTPTTAGTGTVTPTPAYRTIGLATGANGDIARIVGTVVCDFNDDNSARLSLRFSGIGIGTAAENTVRIGLEVDANNYCWIENVTATTFRFTTKNTATGDGAEHSTAAFALDPTTNPVIVLEYDLTTVNVYVDNVLMATYTSATELPDFDTSDSFVHVCTVDISVASTLDVYSGITWEGTEKVL